MNNQVAIYHYDSMERNKKNILSKYKDEIDECVKCIKNIFNVEDNQILYFIDTATSKKAALKDMLEHMKLKEIKYGVAVSINRISRDIDKIIEVQELLKEMDSDIYLIREKQFLFKDLYISIISTKLDMEFFNSVVDYYEDYDDYDDDYDDEFDIDLEVLKGGTMSESFYDYLRDSNRIGVFHYGDRSKIMINKIPYNSKIDILYCIDSYRGDFFDLKSPFKYAGIYDKEADKAYDLEYSIRWHILEQDYQNDNNVDSEDLYNEIGNEINRRVKELIDDDMDDMFDIGKFDSIELTDRDVMKEFMNGKTSSTLENQIISYSTSKPNDLLEYLTNRTNFIEEDSRNFIIDNMEEIINDLIESDAKRKQLRKIEDDKSHIYFKIKNIVDAINESNCKTVNVTINKDGIEQTFIYDADSLKRYDSNYLSPYNIIKRSDREMFEENFGRSEDFYFSDIVKMTYGKSTIYEDNNLIINNKEDNLCL